MIAPRRASSLSVAARPRRAALAVALALASCAGDAAGPGSPLAVTAAPSPTTGLATASSGAARAAAPLSVAGLRTSARPLPSDIAALRDLRGVAVAPDGSTVAYILRAPRFDAAAKPTAGDTRGGWTVEQQLWIVDRRGGASRQLTTGKDPVVAARFSPDGRDLAFVRTTAGKAALSILPLAGGEPVALDLGEHHPADLAWTPDGRSIVFTAVAPRAEPDRKAAWLRGGAVAWGSEWDAVHLFAVPRGGGTPRRIDRGQDTVLRFRLSPDGKRVALVTAASSDPYEAFNHNGLSIVRFSDGAVERQLAAPKFPIPLVEWSPDGRSIGWATTSRGLSHIDELRVARVGGAGAAVDAAAGLDLTMTAFAWAPGSRDLIVLALARTRTALYRLSARGGSHRRLRDPGVSLAGMAAATGSRFATASASGPRGPVDPAVVDLATGAVRKVAAVNPQVAAWKLAPTEVVTWTNKEGARLDGLLTRTANAGGKAPPLLVMPHGGPDGVSTEGWSAWTQYFAARGYSVFQPNYRGGIGHGRAFYEANRGRLGEIELIDIESGVDHLIASGAADEDRLFYGGWSWGGYLSAWTLGHTDRYRAFVVGAGVVDVAVQYVTSDINHGVAAEWEFRGRPWNQPETFERPNPARYLRGAKSPTLILHGTEDDRVSFVNAQILHRALTDLGVEVAMWAYPREGHGFQEPAHVAHRLQVWAAWYDARLPR